MANDTHHYDVLITWDGNRGEGTATYAGYGREHHASIDGKPPIELSADAAYRGNPARLNPEDLLLTAISSCHMLSYLALCARKGVKVLEYRDAARGTMVTDARGGGRFTEVVLHPDVVVAFAADVERATRLHEEAHALCFIASSCRVPIRIEPTIRVETRVTMVDLCIALEDRRGALAELGETLGRAGVSLEGGGVWGSEAHFLVEDGDAAARALHAASIRVVRMSEVVPLRLRQDEPGQLGTIARRMADAGVSIHAQYSDHDGQLILVADDYDRARAVAEEWMRERRV
jgi:organic hydroperoxide reductase OsmC/OhrA